MICLSLTAETFEENLGIIARYRQYIDLLELRADFLGTSACSHLERFPSLTDLPVILTVRRKQDGGAFSGTEADRLRLIAKGLVGGYAYVDLESDLGENQAERIASGKGTRIIRSFHDTRGVPADIPSLLRTLPRTKREIPKAALMCSGSTDLERILHAYAACNDMGKILLGMGDAGFPTRVLTGRLGSLMTYTSAPGTRAAPGHIDPETLSTRYRYRTITGSTRIYGIIGNPVMHTRSPLIHNAGFASLGIDAVYIPFQTDDLEAFFRIADMLPIVGCSVTIPHKEAVLPFLAKQAPDVNAVGACNTMLKTHTGWEGYNTDVQGFLEPLLLRTGTERLARMKATVIGAGGAARAAIYALRSFGVQVLIVNRTREKAEELAKQFGCASAPLSGAYAGIISEFNDIIIQTTSCGMTGHHEENPISEYRFRGTEIAYDIVYSPPVTPFLAQARKAGCMTIGGEEMLTAQGKRQFRLFTGKDLTQEP